MTSAPDDTAPDDTATEVGPAEEVVEAATVTTEATSSDTRGDASSEESALEPPADETGAAAEPKPEPLPETIRHPPTAVAPAAPPRRGGLVGPLLGGVVAAGLGAAAAFYVLPRVWTPPADPRLGVLSEALDAQKGLIAGLSGELKKIGAAPSTESVAAAQAAAAEETTRSLDALGQRIDGIESQMSRLGDALTALDGRLAALEKRPAASGEASASALEAYGREMAALRNEIQQQRDEAKAAKAQIQASSETITQEIEAARAELNAERTKAAEDAAVSAARAGLTRVRAAVDTGSAFGTALDEIRAAGFDIPGGLADQAQGVPTLAALQLGFPTAARGALAASLKATTSQGNGWDRFAAFLRTQSGARSLTPRAGDDADAILSRAEGALRGGDLATAIAEIGKLPEAGQSRMAEWTALAQRRLDATKAITALAAELE
ncbi:MAG: hypothetical protein H6895_05415 [Defluviimonas sp.]|uniref:COG4223 family protein n=1 Tax=Albidovulum sp. TaxID=1872424 RepID=UPI002A32A96C|nr:hypothetical protein [Defluviimonas sp.]